MRPVETVNELWRHRKTGHSVTIYRVDDAYVWFSAGYSKRRQCLSQEKFAATYEQQAERAP